MSKQIIYAGIGSRETPKEIQDIFTLLAMKFAERGYILRSGHADGADMAFEIGCDKANGKKEIYLPWSRFNGSNSKLVVSNPEAFKIAQQFHPYWHNLKDGAKKLQARNSHQVLGLNLETPCDFIICWTKNGKFTGGTAQALRIASDYGIKIFNRGAYDNDKDFMQILKRHITELN